MDFLFFTDLQCFSFSGVVSRRHIKFKTNLKLISHLHSLTDLLFTLTRSLVPLCCVCDVHRIVNRGRGGGGVRLIRAHRPNSNYTL